MNPLLSLENIRMVYQARKGLFGFTPVVALDGVSLSLAEGDTVALVGESGSGKSTLARVALRLVRPTSGRVLFDGADITTLPEGRLARFRQQAQGIFQDPFSSLDPFMRVLDTVEEPLIIHHMGNREKRRELLYQALEEVRLVPAKEFAKKFPHQLSGGQRQRVAIARCLVLRSRLIVADEPVSLLDASSRAEILSLFRELQHRHSLTFIYITHDLSTARQFAPRIAIMYRGKIVETGLTSQVIAQPQHPYTRALLEAVPQPDPSNRFRERRVGFQETARE
jgi:peptide/nickel transport system ATP-binding protein